MICNRYLHNVDDSKSSGSTDVGDECEPGQCTLSHWLAG